MAKCQPKASASDDLRMRLDNQLKVVCFNGALWSFLTKHNIIKKFLHVRHVLPHPALAKMTFVIFEIGSYLNQRSFHCLFSFAALLQHRVKSEADMRVLNKKKQKNKGGPFINHCSRVPLVSKTSPGYYA